VISALITIRQACLLAVAFSAEISSPKAIAEDIHILYYSSTPEVIRDGGRPGIAEVATIVRRAREENPNTLFIHGGASLGPSVLGALDRGAHMIDILNMAEPDMMAIGKREFSYREEQFTLHALSAGFPFISSNLVTVENQEPPEGTEQSLLHNVDGITLGFVALTSDNVVTQYGAHTLAALDTETVINRQSAALRAQGATIVVLLADTDFNDLTKYREAGDVDIILYAHNEDNAISADVKGTILTEGALDGHIVSVKITPGEKTPGESTSPLVYQSETYSIEGTEKDPEISGIIQSYAGRLEVMLKQVIGTSSTSFDTMRANVRTSESAFGNMVADAMRSATGADVAFLNSGGIRGNRSYSVGDVITREDIQQELPFNNTVQLFEISGRDLKLAFEHGASCVDNIDGCFLQISNMRVEFDLSQPVGNRVTNLQIAGEPLSNTKLYRLGTLNFLAQGGDGFSMLRNGRRMTQIGSGKLLWEVVANQVASTGEFSPAKEGRITLIGQQE
jgi:5'-nucleotidase/UDP-sugar diphosphatase